MPVLHCVGPAAFLQTREGESRVPPADVPSGIHCDGEGGEVEGSDGRDVDEEVELEGLLRAAGRHHVLGVLGGHLDEGAVLLVALVRAVDGGVAVYVLVDAGAVLACVLLLAARRQ